MKNVLAGVSTPWDLSESRGKRPQPNLQLTTFLFAFRLLAYYGVSTYDYISMDTCTAYGVWP